MKDVVLDTRLSPVGALELTSFLNYKVELKYDQLMHNPIGVTPQTDIHFLIRYSRYFNRGGEKVKPVLIEGKRFQQRVIIRRGVEIRSFSPVIVSLSVEIGSLSDAITAYGIGIKSYSTGIISSGFGIGSSPDEIAG